MRTERLARLLFLPTWIALAAAAWLQGGFPWWAAMVAAGGAALLLCLVALYTAAPLLFAVIGVMTRLWPHRSSDTLPPPPPTSPAPPTNTLLGR